MEPPLLDRLVVFLGVCSEFSLILTVAAQCPNGQQQVELCRIERKCMSGQCDLSEDCQLVCKCPAESTGQFCQTPVIQIQRHTNGTITDCVVDRDLMDKLSACMITQYCLMGECYVNKTVCDVRCRCPQGVEGANCEIMPTTASVSSTKSSGHNQNTAANRECVVDTDLRDKLSTCMITQHCFLGECYINKTLCGVRCRCPQGIEGADCHNMLATAPVSSTASHGHTQNTATNRGLDPLPQAGECACGTGQCDCDSDELTTGQTVGICLAAVVGVIILFVLVACICLVCKNRRNCLLSCRLRCCNCLSYEDDDRASYDAFVWYKESTPLAHPVSMMAPDEHMALRILLPKLEGELGYRVCMPFRDFPINTPLENNIMNAVRTSRRVILVTSYDTLKDSVWLQANYRQALLTLLNRRKKVIIIKVAEVAKSTDIWVKALFNSARVVEWPALKSPETIERFWLQLELAMPRVNCAKSTSKRPVLVTQESCFSTQTETSTISLSELDNDGFSDIIDVDAGSENSYNIAIEHTDKPLHINDDSLRRKDKTKEDQLLQTADQFEQILKANPGSNNV